MRSLNFFARDADGSASVELVFWMPFFWLTLGFIVDATMLFQAQTRFYDVAREASRQVAIDKMSETQAETFITNRFPNIENVTTNVSINSDLVTSAVSAPLSDLTLFAGFFAGSSLVSGSVTMFIESAATTIIVEE